MGSCNVLADHRYQDDQDALDCHGILDHRLSQGSLHIKLQLIKFLIRKLRCSTVPFSPASPALEYPAIPISPLRPISPSGPEIP